MAPGPGRDYLHARLPAKHTAHVVRLRTASASGPSGHARTRSTKARLVVGVTAMRRAAVPFGRSPVANSVADCPRYGVIRTANVIGSPGRPGCHAGQVAASVRISALDERPDGRGLDQLALPEKRHGLAGGLHGVAG